jgi:hypothetical protein
MILKEWIYFKDMIRSKEKFKFKDSYFEMLDGKF